MSAEDKVRPYHARPEASGQETADAVAAVLSHAQEKDAAAVAKTAPRKQPRWMLPLGINLALFAVYMLIAPPDWATLNPIEGPPLAKQEQDLQAFMAIAAARIEGYRLTNGALPAAYEDMGSTLPEGVEYVPAGNQFRLVGFVGDEAVVYDSASPDPAFGRSAAMNLSEAGG